jgi:Spy/CpxP family protein refolding chaperone
LAALLIFLLGAAAGVLAPRAYYGWFNQGRERRPDRFERMLDRLQLSDQQRTEVQQILGDTRAQFEALRRERQPREREIRRQADERLRQVLTPEQWQQFQQLMEETRGRGRGRGGRDRAPLSSDTPQ